MAHMDKQAQCRYYCILGSLASSPARVQAVPPSGSGREFEAEESMKPPKPARFQPKIGSSVSEVGLPKSRGTFWVAPTNSIIVFLDPYWGSPYWGNAILVSVRGMVSLKHPLKLENALLALAHSKMISETCVVSTKSQCPQSM